MAVKKYKKDLFLILGLVIAGLIIGVVLLLGRQKGSIVQIRVSGETVRTFSLEEETVYEIEGKNGGKNLLCIKDGAAWIEEADCPDKLCKNMGRISLAGQSIVCLPHEVVVEIVNETGGDADNGVDIIAE